MPPVCKMRLPAKMPGPLKEEMTDAGITLSFSTLLLQINNHDKAQKSPIFTQEKSTKSPPKFFRFFFCFFKLQSNKKFCSLIKKKRETVRGVNKLGKKQGGKIKC